MSADKPRGGSPRGRRGGDESGPDAEEPVDEARRRLLRIAVYTPPAIIGTVLLSDEARAQGQAPSCGPAACNPADPGCNPGPGCGPATCGPRP